MLDTVAFLVGGYSSNKSEVYSPDGNCQFVLSPLPISGRIFAPSLVYLDNKIITCPSNTNDTQKCWQYKWTDNAWTEITSPQHTHKEDPGVVHHGNLLIIDDFNPEVYSPVNNSWSTWPKPVKLMDKGPCLISWKDSIVAFGGRENPKGVQIFNSTLYSWSILDPGSAPFELYWPSCTLLPTNKVLLVGNISNDYSAALFDLEKSS